MPHSTLTPQRWLSPLTLPPPQSTGSPKVTLVQSKIKANAAHAGLSPQLVLLSLPSQLPTAPHQSPFLNSSSFHAHLLTTTLVAVVVGTTGPGTTSRSMVKRRVLTILTPLVLPLLMVLANMTLQRLLLKLPLMSKLVKPTRKSRLLLPLSQSQLLLMLLKPYSSNTLLVSSPLHVVLCLTTPSLPLVTEVKMVRITSLWETHGVHLGVTKDISRSVHHQLIQPPVSAVSTRLFTTQSPHDCVDYLS